jgi:DNA-binding NtrC family response regulator
MSHKVVGKQPAPRRRVLVVDDDQGVIGAFRMVLQRGDFEVEYAEDGEEGLAKFEAGQFDLVITDLFLPKMGGLELAAAIKKRYAELPIILITGNLESVASSSGPKPPNVDYLLAKPFMLDEFQATLSQAFASKVG